MLKILLERMRQGYRTSGYPADAPVMPDRFRGAPSLSPEKCPDGCQRCAEVCPTKPIKALIMSEDYELGSYSRDTQIMRVDQMYDGVPIEQYTR